MSAAAIRSALEYAKAQGGLIEGFEHLETGHGRNKYLLDLKGLASRPAPNGPKLLINCHWMILNPRSGGRFRNPVRASCVYRPPAGWKPVPQMQQTLCAKLWGDTIASMEKGLCNRRVGRKIRQLIQS